MWRAESLVKTLMLGKTEGKRRRVWQRMSWLESITDPVMWSWASSGRYWRTEEPGTLQSMGGRALAVTWQWNNYYNAALDLQRNRGSLKRSERRLSSTHTTTNAKKSVKIRTHGASRKEWSLSASGCPWDIHTGQALSCWHEVKRGAARLGPPFSQALCESASGIQRHSRSQYFSLCNWACLAPNLIRQLAKNDL